MCALTVEVLVERNTKAGNIMVNPARFLISNFESDTTKATWVEKRNATDPNSFFIRVQLFLSDRPILGVWIRQVTDDQPKLEKKVCFRQEVSVVQDAEEAAEEELGLHYKEFNAYGVFDSVSLEEEKAQDRLQTDAQAKEKFQAMIPDMNSGGIRTLGLSLDISSVFDRPGWNRVEWTTPGVSPASMSTW
jgi:hypothetical protein